MTEVLTAAITVVLGLVVLVLGQIAQKFFIEPIQEQKRVIGEIAYVILYYANVGDMSQPEIRVEAQQKLRELSGRLNSTLWTVPQYRFFESRGWVEDGAGGMVELRAHEGQYPRFVSLLGDHQGPRPPAVVVFIHLRRSSIHPPSEKVNSPKLA